MWIRERTDREILRRLRRRLSSPTIDGEPTQPVRVVPESSSPETVEGERKTVTALFADIKGSTELMEDLDPEEARGSSTRH